jgi:hypothetical protein
MTLQPPIDLAAERRNRTLDRLGRVLSAAIDQDLADALCAQGVAELKVRLLTDEDGLIADLWLSIRPRDRA